MNANQAGIVVTGSAWMGSGIGSIESALERLFREAQQEITLSVFSISTATDRLFNWMEGALTRGVNVRIVVNRLESQSPPVVARLRRLGSVYPHFHLYAFVATVDADLHAKAVVADRHLALIGSSNLSRRGLLVNHEMGVLIEGAAAATAVKALDRLLSSPLIRRDNCDLVFSPPRDG